MGYKEFICAVIFIILLTVSPLYMDSKSKKPAIDNSKYIQRPSELSFIDWCEVCVKQKPIYYKFCNDEIRNGNLVVPSGMSQSDFCKTMAQFEVDICMAELCKDE